MNWTTTATTHSPSAKYPLHSSSRLSTAQNRARKQLSPSSDHAPSRDLGITAGASEQVVTSPTLTTRYRCTMPPRSSVPSETPGDAVSDSSLRQRIIDAATDVFREHGLAGARTWQI